MTSSRFTERLSIVGIPGILLLLPMAHWNAVSLPAALPKAALFSAVVLLLGITAGAKVLRDRIAMLPDKKILTALSLLIFFAFLSSILSEFPSESLRGAYAGFGLIDLLTLTLFGWAVFLLFPVHKLLIFCRVIAFAGSIPVALGAVSILTGATDIPVAIGSSLGHPNFLGQLLTLTLPVSIALLIVERQQWRLLSGVLMFIQCAGLLLTGSRAALLGTLVGCGLIAFVLFRSSGKARVWLLTSVGAVLIIVFIANALPSNTVVRSIPLLHRLTLSVDSSNGHTTTQSFSVRSHLWGMAIEAIRERPIFGYGQGGVTSTLEQHFRPELLTLERYDAIPDHVHNDLLERLLAGGIIGLLAWIVFAFFVLRSGITAYHTTRNPLVLGLLCALVGHGVALLFGFPTIVDLAMTAAFAAILLQSGGHSRQMQSAVFFPSILLLLFATGFALSDDIRCLIADNEFLSWEQSSGSQDPLKNLESAAAQAPHSAYIPSLATEYIFRGREAEAIRLIDAALANGKPDAHLLIIRAAARLKSGDSLGAREDFSRASFLAPFSPHVWRTWGIALAESGDAAAAKDALEYLLSFSPQYWRWDGTIEPKPAAIHSRYNAFFIQNPDFRTLFLHLGRARFLTGDHGGALDALSHAEQNVDTLSTVGVILAKQGKTKEALAVIEQALALDPQNEILKENVRILRQGSQ
ncbi:MAG: O-antigen ligase family protein [Candidatus Peribacteraceae bacterium]|nr:O-antigen ligase family protein [Candidatus Peribacteraceae bacterium]